MHSSHDCFSDLYNYSRLSRLAASAVAARVRRISLRVSDAPSCLVLANTCRKIVVVRAELASAIRAHPAAARSSGNLKRHAAIRACRRN
jgi:hypothetical protein